MTEDQVEAAFRKLISSQQTDRLLSEDYLQARTEYLAATEQDRQLILLSGIYLLQQGLQAVREDLQHIGKGLAVFLSDWLQKTEGTCNDCSS